MINIENIDRLISDIHCRYEFKNNSYLKVALDLLFLLKCEIISNSNVDKLAKEDSMKKILTFLYETVYDDANPLSYYFNYNTNGLNLEYHIKEIVDDQDELNNIFVFYTILYCKKDCCSKNILSYKQFKDLLVNEQIECIIPNYDIVMSLVMFCMSKCCLKMPPLLRL